MKITFYSNFFTHHQEPFCLEMVKRYGNDFKFVSTIKIPEERLNLGYKNLDNKYDFIVRAYENKKEYDRALKLAIDSDIVIMGSTSDEYIEERLKQDKITFRYCERIFFDGIRTWANTDKRNMIKQKHLKYRENKNLYMLCASAYGTNDFLKIGAYKNKTFKWGYFPETINHNTDKLMLKKSQNNPITIVWVGRFISCKHPEYMVKLAQSLKQEGYLFKIKMLGTGKLFQTIKEAIKQYNLEEEIELLGGVASDKVHYYMEEANIFAFTSDKKEGWGAVLNEAMNSMTAVIANKYIGAVPFLIEDGENGLMYKTFNEFYNKTKELINNKDLREKLSKNAYKTITEEWNSKKGTENLIKLFEGIVKGKIPNIEKGPASKAVKVKE